MKVLLSIKPVFAEKIFDGTKKFEYRKTIFKREGIKTAVVYASSPLKLIIGEFDIAEILHKPIDELWRETEIYAGIDKDFFYSYFKNQTLGYAIRIQEIRKFEIPLSIQKEYKINPPQSFRYI